MMKWNINRYKSDKHQAVFFCDQQKDSFFYGKEVHSC